MREARRGSRAPGKRRLIDHSLLTMQTGTVVDVVFYFSKLAAAS